MSYMFPDRLKKIHKIEPYGKYKVEVSDNELKILFNDTLGIKINDPNTVTTARIYANKENLAKYLSKKKLLEHLYSLKFTYEGFTEPFHQFIEDHKTRSKEEIANELLKLENEYVDSSDSLGEDMLTAILSYSIKKSKGIPTNVKYSNLNLTIDDLTRIITKISQKKKYNLLKILKLDV